MKQFRDNLNHMGEIFINICEEYSMFILAQSH